MSEKEKQNSLFFKQRYVTDWGISLFNLIKKVGKFPLLKTYSFSDIISSTQFKKSSPLIAVGFIFVFIILILWKISQFQVPNNSSISEQERITLEDKARGTLIQVIGGLFFFVTAYLTWKNSEISHKQLIATQEKLEFDKKTTNKNLELADSKQITERFSKAVEQLGNKESITVRLGAIYSLERIAKDSPNDHWTIMEVLTAFIREKSHDKSKPNSEISQDIQAALTVIGRRNTENDIKDERLYLNKTNLSGAELRNANFSNIYFYETKFNGANLYRAKFNNALLGSTDFTGSHLLQADFTGADISDAKFIDDNQSDLKTKITVEQILKAKNWDKAKYNPNIEEQLQAYL